MYVTRKLDVGRNSGCKYAVVVACLQLHGCISSGIAWFICGFKRGVFGGFMWLRRDISGGEVERGEKGKGPC